jgi:AcrR family transcriptional regulator
MGRPTGSKNSAYDEKRRELAAAVLPRLLADGGATSLNELAVAASTSVPTLKHYFEDRSGVVAAALRHQKELAQEHLLSMERPQGADVGASLEMLTMELIHVWRPWGVGRVFVVGLAAGVYDAQVGLGYLDGVLEPTLQALEQRLRVHAARRELDLTPEDGVGLRAAALSFLSPILLALIHQDALSGERCRPLDVEAFAKIHISRFLRAYAPCAP